ncbi:MAG: hypothetical protein HS108_12535 [Planctomycetes bacterium]|jgi:hypothetical protein|nr:hypothetical protein [Planctomycetota bacterium]MCL4731854.1 hypothetical protein [Planctomycetota bacterium]
MMRHCLYCGFEGELVWVHGHGQCARCGINVEPCCDGAACEPRPQQRQDHTRDPAQVRTWQNRV